MLRFAWIRFGWIHVLGRSRRRQPPRQQQHVPSELRLGGQCERCRAVQRYAPTAKVDKSGNLVDARGFAEDHSQPAVARLNERGGVRRKPQLALRVCVRRKRRWA